MEMKTYASQYIRILGAIKRREATAEGIIDMIDEMIVIGDGYDPKVVVEDVARLIRFYRKPLS